MFVGFPHFLQTFHRFLRTLVMNCPEFRETLSAGAHSHLCEKVAALGGARQSLMERLQWPVPPSTLAGDQEQTARVGTMETEVPELALEANTLFPTTHAQLWNPQIWNRQATSCPIFRP